MTIVVENANDYDIVFLAEIWFIVPERYVVSDYWRQWQQHHLPRSGLSEENVRRRNEEGDGFLPRGGQLEFLLNWEAEFGKLPPGEYVIALSLGGWV